MEVKEEILYLYFYKHLKQKEIAEKLNVSKYKVSRVVSNDSRYIEEKEDRKRINQKDHKLRTLDYIKKSRKNRRIDYEYEQLKKSHIQASSELSGGRKPISNRAFRNWNTSIYKYNSKTKSYNLRKDIVAGFDVPKRIKW